MILAQEMARVCLRKAMTLRKRAGFPIDFAISPFDLAQAIGVEVWYQPSPSLAGMYAKHERAIVIGSDRPLGYQSSVCAHELGHHEFGHGSRIDEYIPGERQPRSDDPEEAVADLLGAHLLMPEAAVRRAFQLRSWNAASPSDVEAFAVAGILGVGYSALVHHLRWTLGAIPQSTFDRLINVTPKSIRLRVLPDIKTEELILVDDRWTDRSVDVTVGTVLCLPPGVSVEGRAIQVIERKEGVVVARATARGISRADRGDWSVFVRVMQDRYFGVGVHRHMEDPVES